MERYVKAIVLAVAISTAAASGWLAHGFGASATAEESADAEGREAIDAWLQPFVDGDKAALQAILAPEFQVVHDDGTSYTAENYVADGAPMVAPIPKPEVERLLATRHGDHLIVRYWLKLRETFGGDSAAPLAPRLTVFRRSGDKWLVVAHSNFAPIK